MCGSVGGLFLFRFSAVSAMFAPSAQCARRYQCLDPTIISAHCADRDGWCGLAVSALKRAAIENGQIKGPPSRGVHVAVFFCSFCRRVWQPCHTGDAQTVTNSGLPGWRLSHAPENEAVLGFAMAPVLPAGP